MTTRGPVWSGRGLDSTLETKLLHDAKRTSRALDLSRCARIALRSVGLSYAQLVQRLLDLGIGDESAWRVE